MFACIRGLTAKVFYGKYRYFDRSKRAAGGVNNAKKGEAFIWPLHPGYGMTYFCHLRIVDQFLNRTYYDVRAIYIFIVLMSLNIKLLKNVGNVIMNLLLIRF